MSEVFARRVFIASIFVLCAAAAFGYGLAVERYQLGPYGMIHEAIRVAKSYAQFGEIIPEGRRIVAPPGASRERFLDSSVKLDEALGPEQIWAIFCDEPFEVAPLTRRLKRGGGLEVGSGCTVDRLDIIKAKRP